MKQSYLTNLKRITAMLLIAVTAFLSGKAYAAPGDAGTVSGTVYDGMGEVAIGATVRPLDKNYKGVATDIDGVFTIKSDKPLELEISYIGCETQKVTVKPGEPVEIRLKDTASTLNDVVVVGFATQKKVNLTGAVGVATAKDIADRPVQNAAAALQGVIPGLNISNSSSGGELNAKKGVNIRGMATKIGRAHV